MQSLVWRATSITPLLVLFVTFLIPSSTAFCLQQFKRVGLAISTNSLVYTPVLIVLLQRGQSSPPTVKLQTRPTSCVGTMGSVRQMRGPGACPRYLYAYLMCRDNGRCRADAGAWCLSSVSIR